jgi:hypothetical protein
MKELTQEYLKEILDYNHFNGEFHWIKRRQKVQIYSVAGAVNGNGYRYIKINGRQYRAHRLAFLYMTGEFPPEQCDHINHNRLDNRWINLRLVSNQENQRNRSMRADNKSGFTGVCWHKQSSKWVAHIKIKGKLKHLGCFKELAEAITCRQDANINFGFHANHGLA